MIRENDYSELTEAQRRDRKERQAHHVRQYNRRMRSLRAAWPRGTRTGDLMVPKRYRKGA